MDADFSVEFGREDPVLDFPWTDPAGKLAYVDLKGHPELMPSILEAREFCELAEFLRTLNSPRSVVQTAKCDAWATTELSAEEDVYDSSHKFACYVDVVFADLDVRLSSFDHEHFGHKLVELLARAPEIPAAAEVCLRRCYFEWDGGVREGCYFTLYASGYGNDAAGARQNWGVGLKLMANAIMQLSAGEYADS